MIKSLVASCLLLILLFPVFLEAQELPSYQKYQGPIKPGVEITQDNFNTYLPELKKLLPPVILKWMSQGLKEGLITMPIVENINDPLSKGMVEATRKYEGTARLLDNNQLADWVAGIPFPEPKNVLELAWNCYPTISRTGNHDDSFMPAWLGLFQGTKYQKGFSWAEYNRRYRGRTDIPPLGDMREFKERNICQKETILVTNPHEVRGFIQLRTRYWDVDKPDECYGYIPAIRRIRRMTGSDLTDPLLGSDYCPDDGEIWRQKMTSRMRFRALAYQDFLVTRIYFGSKNKPPYDYHKTGSCFQAQWQIKPLWVVEVMMNDKNYIYSKRLLYIEGVPLEQNGNYSLHWGETFDQRGRLFKGAGFGARYDNGMGMRTLFSWIYVNALNNHCTVIDGHPSFDPGEDFQKTFPLNESKAFSIKGLLRGSR